MGTHKPEIVELLSLVEQKYSKNLCTTTDFEEFSLYLQRQLGNSISSSTLKRLWGYVNDNHVPRAGTLDILARYLDYTSFSAFCKDLKCRNASSSSFISAKQLQIQTMCPGDEVEIGWSPNRYVRLLYQGDAKFEVIEADQTKLQRGDQFEAVGFIMGYPLQIAYVLRDGVKTPPFVAGYNGGLTFINSCSHG